MSESMDPYSRPIRLILGIRVGTQHGQGDHRQGADDDAPLHGVAPSSWRSRGPDSSGFGMNPHAALESSRLPKSDASRVERRMTRGVRSRRPRRSATSNPEASGSTTSRRTTSGRSDSAYTTAEAPLTASPTTA